jgi:hypothetical protein
VSDPIPVRESRHVEIVPYLFTPDNQVTLNPQRLIWRRYPEHVSRRQLHFRDLQGPVPDQLTDPRLDIAQFAEDDLPPGSPGSSPNRPSIRSLQAQRRSVAKILQNMVMIIGEAVIRP